MRTDEECIHQAGAVAGRDVARRGENAVDGARIVVAEPLGARVFACTGFALALKPITWNWPLSGKLRGDPLDRCRARAATSARTRRSGSG